MEDVFGISAPELKNYLSDYIAALPQGETDKLADDTIMLLVNALAFDASWQELYTENQIRDDVFTLEKEPRRISN